MADGADDCHVWDQLKVLTGLKLPGINWNANNMRMEFDIFWGTLSFVLEGMEIPRDKWYLYILQQLGREGMQQWTTASKPQSTKQTPLQSSKHSRKATSWKRHTGHIEAFISAVRSKEEGTQQPLSPPGLKTWSACVSGRMTKKNKDA